MKAIAVFPGTREIKLIEQAEPHITRPTEVKAADARSGHLRHGQGDL